MEIRLIDRKIYSNLLLQILKMKKLLINTIALILLNSALLAQHSQPGHFVKRYWYQQGIEHGNPNFNSSVRVNAPETVVHPIFGGRVETRSNGMIQILTGEDLLQIETAELYAEIWGGHPGTKNKEVSVNGRSTYSIPEVGTEKNHCTYHYPSIPLKITDLVNGYNAIQFSCQKGSSFWGHFLIDNACLKLGLKNGHKDLKEKGLQEFKAVVAARPLSSDAIELQLETFGLSPNEITKVEYFGYYEGFDDNRNGMEMDWHGYTKNKIPQNILGQSDKVPFKSIWNTSMLSAQNNVKVMAEIHFKKDSAISYITSEINNIVIPVRQKSRIDRFQSYDMPIPFWSRANKLKTCTIVADIVPKKIEKAELHIIVWDGGEGEVKDHFKFNGKALPLVSGKHAHDVIYRVFEIEPSLIKAGENKIEVLSDTEHHGIEVLLPGPALVIRSQK